MKWSPVRCPECTAEEFDGEVTYVEYIAAKRAILGFDSAGVLHINGLISKYDYDSDIIDRRSFWCSKGHEWSVGDVEMEFE